MLSASTLAGLASSTRHTTQPKRTLTILPPTARATACAGITVYSACPATHEQPDAASQPLSVLHVAATYLFVGVHEYECVLELLLLHNGVELLLADAYPLNITAVHHVDDGLRVGVVTPPVGPDAGLPAQVPHLELDVLVRYRLNIETNGCRRGEGGGGGQREQVTVDGHVSTMHAGGAEGWSYTPVAGDAATVVVVHIVQECEDSLVGQINCSQGLYWT